MSRFLGDSLLACAARLGPSRPGRFVLHCILEPAIPRSSPGCPDELGECTCVPPRWSLSDFSSLSRKGEALIPVALLKLRVDDPLRHGNSSVFPIFTESTSDIDDRLSAEALIDQLVLVEEVREGGSIPNRLVENKVDLRVLFLEGEELVGAKPNRILNTSVLRAPFIHFAMSQSRLQTTIRHHQAI